MLLLLSTTRLARSSAVRLGGLFCAKLAWLPDKRGAHRPAARCAGPPAARRFQRFVAGLVRPPRGTALVLCAALVALTGCSAPGYLRSRDRYKHGVVFVLPGIEGKSVWNRNIALGLDEGGVRSAIEVYDWTLGVPGATVLNITSHDRNRREAARLARRIVEHRDRYPGSPVYLIGHSAGGGVAAFALEALPPGRQIDQAILLAPALSPEYNLTTALRRTRAGILNLYSELDVGFLLLGTTAVGTADRSHSASAGCVGFRVPGGLSKAEQTLYTSKLRQVEWNTRLRKYGASGTHMGWASREFAREYLAPIILRNTSAQAARVAADEAPDAPALEPERIAPPPGAAPGDSPSPPRAEPWPGYP